MSGSPFEKPLHLGQVLQKIVRRRGLAERSSREELDLLWREAAGERVAGKSYVKRLRNGTLEIGVRNGAILEELTSYLHDELLMAVRSRSPKSEIQTLRFVRVR